MSTSPQLLLMMHTLFLIFLFCSFLGTILSISSNSMFNAWMGLEINLLSFIPLLSNNSNSMENESMLKYFLIQSIGSSTFLFSSLMNSLFILSSMNHFLFNMMIMFTLLLKMGAAPLHNWLINIIEGTSLFVCFLILTWQKIAPLCLSFYCSMNINFISMFIILSASIGAIGGLNQTSIRKILAFSSINHVSWLLSSLFISKLIFLIYFIIYLMINLNLILIMKKFSIFHLNQMFNFSKKTLNSWFFLPLMSLGGLPPLSGFMSKWLIIESLIINKFNIISMILIMSSLITLFYYMQLYLSSLLILSTNNKMTSSLNNQLSLSPTFIVLSTLSNLSLILILLFKSSN
uniref:NADH-ubiquinone oxidoreductase chain 2 n=1 Tax=Lepinotus reticulatus TaxID=209981 RepID=A0A3S8IE99_9NEOP|nr:NADH dehydrogenase subunit 2 [Lepinotus reticulatus]